jgi:hypothetical protein
VAADDSAVNQLLSVLAASAGDDDAGAADAMASLEQILSGVDGSAEGFDASLLESLGMGGLDHAGGEDEYEDGKDGHHYDDEGDWEHVDDEDEDHSVRTGDSPPVQMPSRPWAFEVWQQQHASAAGADESSKEPKVLSEKQWDELVTRLNE